MKTWMAILTAALCLSAVAAGADEPRKTLPAPGVPEKLPAPTEKPALAPVPVPAAEHTGQPPCGSCRGHRGACLAWLTYHPSWSGCCYTAVAPRPTPLYAFFMCYPCLEGHGPACAGSTCGGCAANRH